MADEYRWDSEQIKDAAALVKTYAERLAEQKDKYAAVPGEIAEAWQSVNSDELGIVVETDLEKYQKVLEQLEDISESLTKAAEDYSDGESAMLRSITRMVSETELERLIS